MPIHLFLCDTIFDHSSLSSCIVAHHHDYYSSPLCSLLTAFVLCVNLLFGIALLFFPITPSSHGGANGQWEKYRARRDRTAGCPGTAYGKRLFAARACGTDSDAALFGRTAGDGAGDFQDSAMVFRR